MEDKIFELETIHLASVIDFLLTEIRSTTALLSSHKDSLVEIRKEMWEEGMSALDDVERNIDINQYLNMEAIETSKYKNKLENLDKYQKMKSSPYFGRVDFEEDEVEKVYIGYHNLMDDETYDVLVYDWRAPISSVFYNADLGKASYEAPCGVIEGQILLKRQYHIEKGKLKFYFDASTTITDNILKEALGKNVSDKMRNIVETLQQEQNNIIRNKKNDMLIVQGVAGSGKTSIAMHRVAFLLYNTRGEEGLSHNDMLIISPNSLFGDYISGVLPELGEKNVKSSTLEDLYHAELRGNMETRNRQLELMLSSKHRDRIRRDITFKGSNEFVTILERYLEWLEEYGMEFDDIVYNDILVMESDEILAHFMDNQIGMSVAKRLARIENIVVQRIKPLEKDLVVQIEKQLVQEGGYDYEENKEANRRVDELRIKFMAQLTKYTRNNYMQIYINLVKDFNEFKKYAQGINLPNAIQSMLRFTYKRLINGNVSYEDGSVLLYIKLKLDDSKKFSQYKQVLIDEAQDYHPIHYHIFKMLFKRCQYTMLGDYGQTIEKDSNDSVYDDAIKILNPQNPLRINLTKSYRSSYEINKFITKFRDDAQVTLAFERNETEPEVLGFAAEQDLHNELVRRVEMYSHEFAKIAVLCKDKAQVKDLKVKLGRVLKAQYILLDDAILKEPITVMPTYMAKGLEYDVVIAYDVSDRHYNNVFDKQLLYIACSRALHRLDVLYLGKCSRFL
ncbi:MAG: hypothetical protein BEN18_04095 [Epulopiscium sp. Nuni2H_MBin001]|nr:MAG: hypothetical protein BEN18_04095 [Epulopiscium sp. Nuni2H_MBin001]